MKRKQTKHSLFVADAYIRYMNNLDTLIGRLKNPELAEVRNGFLMNIARVEGLLILPGLFAFNLYESMIEEDNSPSALNKLKKAKKNGNAIMVDRLKWVKESAPWIGIEKIDLKSLKGEELLHKCVELQVQSLLNKFYFSSGSELYKAAEGLLLSATVLVWTAVECVAKDSWIYAINSCPESLSRLINSSKEKGSMLKQNREFKLWELAQHDFDMRHKMGTILSKKFKFSTLSGILEAYKEVFRLNNQTVGKLNNSLLKYLECMRHLIVHKSAIIDEEFLKRTNNTKLKVGQKHYITDQDVRNWLDKAYDAGEAILVTVDNWVTENRRSTQLNP